MHVPAGTKHNISLGTQKQMPKVPLCYKNGLTLPPWIVGIGSASNIFLPKYPHHSYPHIRNHSYRFSTIAPLQTNKECVTTRTPYFPAAARLERILWYADMSMTTWPSVWPTLEQTRSQSPEYVGGNAAVVHPSVNRKYFLWARHRPGAGRGLMKSG